MYLNLVFKVKSSAKLPLQIVVHVDKKMTEQLKSATEIVRLLRPACLRTFVNYHGKMQANCLDVNTSFINSLVNSDNRPSFIDYNNLLAPHTTKESPLAGTHHMVELLYKDYFIGVDVAAEQYRKDWTIAEITIGSSHEHLYKLLLSRFKLTHSWWVNFINKRSETVKLLQQNRTKESLDDEKIELVEEKVEQLIEVAPSNCHCVIL